MATTKQYGVDFPAATTPLAGTETLSIVQGGVTKDATTQSIANLASGSVPTGTGYRHVTAGVEDAAASSAATVSADLQGTGLDVDAAGFRGVPINSQSANYTLVASDFGKMLFHPAADTTARVFTIPSNASVPAENGIAFAIDNDSGAGVITVAITADTLVLAGTGATGSRTLASGGFAVFWKVGATRWRCVGTGLT